MSMSDTEPVEFEEINKEPEIKEGNEEEGDGVESEIEGHGDEERDGGEEDLDEEIDEDKLWEDDFYTEDLREKTSKLQYDIEEAYLEFLNEKE